MAKDLLDDLGYVQQSPDEAEVLLTLLAERYERRSVMVTSNLVFSQWDRIFRDQMATAAAIDRLVHHAVVLEFDVTSYRTDRSRRKTPPSPAPRGRTPGPLLPRTALPHLICYRTTIVASQFLLPKEATMSTISQGTRQELVTAVADRYRQSTAAEKRLILDEFVALTGYHRKHAVRVLNGSAITPRARRGRRCVYDAAVTEGLIVLWEASDRMCGKRLKALLPTLVPALEHHGHLSLDSAVRERLLAVSAATIDRRLASARAVTAGQRRRRRSALNGLRGSVPVRTFGDWKDPLALLDEIRAVQHHLAALAAGATVYPMPERDADLAWRAGEVRPTHRARQRPPRHWRTRQDPFETSWPRIVQWLETEPHRTAKELFDRLCREQPGVFLPGQLRTLQRRVRDWRRLAARRLLFADPTTSPQDAVGSPIAVDARNEIATDLARLDQDAGATPPAGCPGGDHLERPGSRAPDPSPETEGTGTIFLRQAGSILK